MGLHNVPIPASIKNVYLALVSRVKIMSELDTIAVEKETSARWKNKIVGDQEQGKELVLPTINGEAVVIRILANQGIMELEKLGMEPKIMHTFRELVHKPNGVVLVTGPTGSGKTTTLFSGIKEINVLQKK